jgi:hypothetical protein
MNAPTVNSQQAAALSKPLSIILLCLRLTVGWQGMFDFQVVEDVNICNKVLANVNRGPRPWYS